jgi:hypothetical protein
VPTLLDTLPQPGRPRFLFDIADADEGARVQMWINDCEVLLPNQRDVHLLLRELCLKPSKKYKGQDLQNKLAVNAHFSPSLFTTDLGRAGLGWESQSELGGVL